MDPEPWMVALTIRCDPEDMEVQQALCNIKG